MGIGAGVTATDNSQTKLKENIARLEKEAEKIKEFTEKVS